MASRWSSTVPGNVNCKWCAELPYCLLPARRYEPLKWFIRKDLRNPLHASPGKMGRLFRPNRLPILHSLAVAFTCQRSGIDQASALFRHRFRPISRFSACQGRDLSKAASRRAFLAEKAEKPADICSCTINNTHKASKTVVGCDLTTTIYGDSLPSDFRRPKPARSGRSAKFYGC
jgi:hypothetical protein